MDETDEKQAVEKQAAEPIHITLPVVHWMRLAVAIWAVLVVGLLATDIYLRATAPKPETLRFVLTAMEESEAERDRELLKAVEAVEAQADLTADEVCALRKDLGRVLFCP
jgi:hypothetical protein